MENETVEGVEREAKLDKLRKQQILLFIAAPLTGFMAVMKYFGLFSIGAFPPYVEAGLSVYCLVFAIYTTVKIKSIESEDET